jgi:hypothetical protein
MHIGMANVRAYPDFFPDGIQENRGVFQGAGMLEAFPAQAAIKLYDEFVHSNEIRNPNIESRNKIILELGPVSDLVLWIYIQM